MKSIKKQSFLFTLMTALFYLVQVAGAQFKVLDYDFPLPSSDFGKSVIQRREGGFAVSGYSFSYPPGFPERGYDWFFMKLQNDGTVERSKLIGFSRETNDADHCFSITQLESDSNFVLAGRMTHT